MILSQIILTFSFQLVGGPKTPRKHLKISVAILYISGWMLLLSGNFGAKKDWNNTATHQQKLQPTVKIMIQLQQKKIKYRKQITW